MSAGYKCDRCGRFYSGSPIKSIKSSDSEIIIKPNEILVASIQCGVLCSDVTYPRLPDLCTSCFCKKIDSAINDALATKGQKK